MGAVTGSIPNLINGVSQQAPAVRLPSQGELAENFYPTILDGNRKRPRTDHEAVLAALPEDTFTHFILRDEDEKYVVAITTAGVIRVWDFDGNEKTVTNESATYLNSLTSAKDDIRALTVADHTFIVNRKKVVAAGTATAPTRPFEALVHVLSLNYGKTYRIKVNGSDHYVTVHDGTSAWNSKFTDTVRLAEHLRALLDVGAAGITGGSVPGLPWTAGDSYAYSGPGGFNTGNFQVGRYHSTVYIKNTVADFTLQVEDGYGGRAMKDVKSVVQKFSDLPLYGPDGYVVKVLGDADNGFDDYWVEFQKDADVNSMGVWRECVAPGARLGLNATTMPHILVRNANGTFTFKAATWDERKCGDLETSPDPSFVGQIIEDVIFHKNRLGLLTKENIVLSEAGKFYNFYRTTLTALLDTDPIDVAANHTKVSLLRHAIPFQKELLIFSDETQFVFTGKDLLTPKTVSIDPLTELHVNPAVRPIAMGANVYFASERDGWATLIEYFLDKALETADYDDVTGHVPAYIPAGVEHLIGSPNLNAALLTTAGDPTAVYVYKFYFNGQEKLQSAWSRWSFPNVSAVVNMAFDKGKVRLLLRRAGSLVLETMDMEERVFDIGLKYQTALDQHVLLTTTSYNGTTDQTTFTLPYNVPVGLKCVTAPHASWVAGVELTPVSTGANTVTFEGDLRNLPVRFGVPFESRYRFSPFFARAEDGKTSLQDGRTQVLTLNIAYSRTAYFRVEVTCGGRAMRTYPFNGRILGDPNNVLGELAIDEGRFSIPIMSRNDRVSIDLVNDTWLPCSFTSAQWRGTFNPNTRQQ